ncbi:hypothetical protein [Nocardia sp. NRRL S-836]|uniref:hypothetical protein n=1 Tax=Nocardia sp. NRRL S-836 TaxID=1519492 RepID=UPI0006B02861|nr:hypothetical protein [Nocardia sp. NRRL S-836]KOV84691.1 hypothetical protein ADL03_15570 [Nocardia sp. NRRL S-836]
MAQLITSPKQRIQIAPHLTLTSDLFEIAAAGVDLHTPELGSLRWEAFISRQWTLVPDELTGEPYKAELRLSKFSGVNYWLAPDRRGGEQPKPHNHPWDFHSATLAGLLVEDRVDLVDGELVHTPGVEHPAGDVNRVGRETFHEVVDLEPHTMTLMMYGPGMNHWGYLDADGNYTQAVAPKGFLARLRELNPHQR